MSVYISRRANKSRRSIRYILRRSISINSPEEATKSSFLSVKITTILTLSNLRTWAVLSRSGISPSLYKMVSQRFVLLRLIGYIPAGQFGLTGGYLRTGLIG